MIVKIKIEKENLKSCNSLDILPVRRHRNIILDD